ncbi:hypothetical protein V7111_23470 [Neobacillus niacini]|uniref:hypothetical protein n=1 Tax=Neobacillus niacini TaxID=86668 RepID=UPI00300174FA
MNLTVEQYKQMRLTGMKDQEILKALHYSPNSKRMLQKWKAKNGINPGKDKTQLLDRREVFEYMKSHSLLNTAQHFGVHIECLYKWEKRQREIS